MLCTERSNLFTTHPSGGRAWYADTRMRVSVVSRLAELQQRECSRASILLLLAVSYNNKLPYRARSRSTCVVLCRAQRSLHRASFVCVWGRVALCVCNHRPLFVRVSVVAVVVVV